MSGAESMQGFGSGSLDLPPDLTLRRLQYEPDLYMGVPREQVIDAIPVVVAAGERAVEPLSAEEILWRTNADVSLLPMVVYEPVLGGEYYLRYTVSGSGFSNNEN